MAPAAVAVRLRRIVPMSREIMPTPLVLVVDDEALIRWSVSEALAESGYVVRLAGSAAEARGSVARRGRMRRSS